MAIGKSQRTQKWTRSPSWRRDLRPKVLTREAVVAAPMPFATGRSARTRWSGHATVTVSTGDSFTPADPSDAGALLSRIWSMFQSHFFFFPQLSKSFKSLLPIGYRVFTIYAPTSSNKSISIIITKKKKQIYSLFIINKIEKNYYAREKNCLLDTL